MSGWYSRFTPDGEHIVSGAGSLFLDGRELGIVGWQPVPIDNDRVVFNGGPSAGLQQLELDTRQVSSLDPRELIELAGGGGKWAGRHAPTDTLVVSDGRAIIGAGQPALAADGAITYRVGDDRIEPSICLTAEAWGNGRGQIICELRLPGEPLRNVTVGEFEARPVLIDTLEGPWVFCMTRGGFHLRPLFDSRGYHIVTGEDRNINGHAVCVDDDIRCVWQDTQGNPYRWSVSLSSSRINLSRPEPEPEPIPEPKPEPSMPESLLPTVQAVRARYPTPPSNADLGRMLNEIAWTHRADGWGLNLKPSGNSTAQPGTGIRIAVDILHHRPTDTIWDCFQDAGGETNPAWNEAEPHNDPARIWVAPVRPDGASPDPNPDPDPPEPEPVPAGDVVGLLTQLLDEQRKLNRHFGVR